MNSSGDSSGNSLRRKRAIMSLTDIPNDSRPFLSFLGFSSRWTLVARR